MTAAAMAGHLTGGAHATTSDGPADAGPPDGPADAASPKSPQRPPQGFDVSAITDEHLMALSGDERAQLAQRLAALAAASAATPGSGPLRRRRWPAILALAACLAMIPWTLVLAATLPDRYVAAHWSTTWVGFDTLLLISFATTAWAAWRRSRAVWAATVVTATLLGCDAWFDITTASTTSDVISSAITAAGGLPLAAILIYLICRPPHRPAQHPAPRR
jgi:hypothetical protein